MKTKVIPGMEETTIESLDKLIERYVEARDRRMALTKIEKAAKDALEKGMGENKKKTYRHAGGKLQCVIEEGESKMKVKKVDSDGEEEEENEEEI